MSIGLIATAAVVGSMSLSVFLGLNRSAPHDTASLLCTLVALLIAMIGIGKRVAGRFSAILITERNTMSLSRVQAVLWTVLLLAGYLNRVLWSMRWNLPDPLAVCVPQTLWWLTGISAISLVGTPLILSNKSDRTASDKTIQETAVALRLSDPDKRTGGGAVQTIKNNADGTVYRNNTSADASFMDIFQGDEVGDAGRVDLSKVQMFFFSIILVLVYLVFLVKLTETGGKDLPAFSEGMIALLGISHAGYLANKAVDHSQSSAGPLAAGGTQSVQPIDGVRPTAEVPPKLGQ